MVENTEAPDPLHDVITDHQRRVIAELMKLPGARRNDLAERLGFSPQTMMRTVNPLVERNIITEVTEISGARGKPPRLMSLNPSSLLTLGVTIAQGRNIVDLSDINGKRVATTRVIRDFGSAREQLDNLLKQIEIVLAEHDPGTRVISMGVVVQGYFLTSERRIVSRSDPAGWAGISLQRELQSRTGLPVMIVNDGKAFAASLIGTEVGQNFIAVILGSGIGGGIVANGQLLTGAYGNAGELGRFFADDDQRPTETNLLRALGLRDWTDWQGVTKLPGDLRDTFDHWVATAGRRLSHELSLILALLDFDTVFLGSRMPADVISAITDAVRPEPLGADLASQSASFTQLPPAVIGRHIPSFSSFASRIATQSFLLPEQFHSETTGAPADTLPAASKKDIANG